MNQVDGMIYCIYSCELTVPTRSHDLPPQSHVILESHYIPFKLSLSSLPFLKTMDGNVVIGVLLAKVVPLKRFPY